MVRGLRPWSPCRVGSVRSIALRSARISLVGDTPSHSSARRTRRSSVGCIRAIRPAVRDTRNQAGDKTDNAVRGHARRTAKLIPASSPIVKNAISAGHVKIFAARYDLVSGKIDLLP